MGDNIYLGDRDGVRTPMQWSADRNAGFPGGLRPALPAAADGPGVRLPGGERRGRCATRARSCTGCSACSRSASSTTGVRRSARFEVLSADNPSVLALHPPTGGRDHPLRQQPQPLRPAGGAAAGPVRGAGRRSSSTAGCPSPRSASGPTSLTLGGHGVLLVRAGGPVSEPKASESMSSAPRAAGRPPKAVAR